MPRILFKITSLKKIKLLFLKIKMMRCRNISSLNSLENSLVEYEKNDFIPKGEGGRLDGG